MSRKEKYISFIKSYPIKATLLVLDEYEKKELYEECAIIKKALDEYNDTQVNTKKVTDIVGKINFPTSLSKYNSQEFQKILQDYNIIVEDKSAKEKATLIKLKLPVNGE